MSRSVRSYQRELTKLRRLLVDMQWVQPRYNGSLSCSGCGQQKHFGCDASCPAAAITGDFGKEPRRSALGETTTDEFGEVK